MKKFMWLSLFALLTAGLLVTPKAVAADCCPGACCHDGAPCCRK